MTIDELYLEEIMRKRFFELLDEQLPRFIRRYEQKRREVNEGKKDKDLDFKKNVIYGATAIGLRTWAKHQLDDPSFGKDKKKSKDQKTKDEILGAFRRGHKL